ncbi:sigma-70, region 4 [Leptospira inadai serovar Lyme str. 10]|uniref:Sigma-70, region 4 n=2 Tax=Leptospira inadai serovar Lyme TaxID=293084 RepID=V6HC34_9LEPT|nr:sigma-70 family RNA polymerase sigma factor [Leptospira inadai]EQA36328.1 sigma-70, region 4 [Leptospira inadai serovar Lyme str. 10]PNV75560.1 RNA polymerase subunit sigma-24 [Leptospira inadai serovar Lyme]
MRDFTVLVTEAAKGQETAFTELFSRFEKYVQIEAGKRIRDESKAEDLTQEVFLETWRVLPNLRAPEAFPFLLRRLVLKHSDRILRRKDLVSAEFKPETTMARAKSDRDEEAWRKEVLQALEELPKEERELLNLRYFGELSYEEISERTGIAGGNLKNRLRRSRELLRRNLLTKSDRRDWLDVLHGPMAIAS